MPTPEEPFNLKEHLHYRLCAWDHFQGIPCKFLFDYYPRNSFPPDRLTPRQRDERRLITAFKDGFFVENVLMGDIARELVAQYVAFAIRYAFREETSLLTFLCAPASTQERREQLFRQFSARVAQLTGMRNGFDAIKIEKEGTQSHIEGKEHIPVQYTIPADLSRKSYFILFDDLFTSGNTLLDLTGKAEKYGGFVVGYVSVGRTVRLWEGPRDDCVDNN